MVVVDALLMDVPLSDRHLGASNGHSESSPGTTRRG
jgi:hypothetical protein